MFSLAVCRLVTVAYVKMAELAAMNTMVDTNNIQFWKIVDNFRFLCSRMTLPATLLAMRQNAAAANASTRIWTVTPTSDMKRYARSTSIG